MTNLSEESDSEDSDGIWQQVPNAKTNKRRLTKSPKMHEHKKFNLDEEPSTSKSNQFQILSEKDDEEEQEADKTPKPPPIYIPDVLDISKMIKCISKEVSDFNYKSLRDNNIRLMIKSVDSYRKIVKYFETNNISYHTYQLKQERAYRAVLKGLHHSTPVNDIKAELLALGFQVREIVNVRSRVTKMPLPLFFVDLDPNPNNKEIFNLKYISNAIVSVEPPKKIDDLVQCHRCQQFGHTKSYCKRPFKCVKCGLDHATPECTKTIQAPPKCVNCLQNHTANYKGCAIYQQLIQQKRNNLTRQSRVYQIPQTNAFVQANHIVNNSNGATYAQAVIGNTSSPEMKFLERLERMMDRMFDMMTKIMEKLCK